MSTASSEMPRVQVPSNLPDLVKAAFNKARSNGDLTFFPTQVALLHVNSIPFQLRFSPALANKPKPPPPSDGAGKKNNKPAPNPFADPLPSMLIAPLPPAHNLVLNKFAVVAEHFILSTAAFAPQTHLLEPGDLAAAHACVAAYAAAGRDLFAFFNSGPHSGASQPHRHLQLLDVGKMREGLEEGQDGGGAWDVLAESVLDGEARARVPFWTAARALRPDMSGEELGRVYRELYRRACRVVLGEVEGGHEGLEGGEARISYNLAMTRDVMVICPRTREGAAVMGTVGGKEEEEEVGWLGLNGTVLAGTALVKSQAEWDALRADPGQVAAVLGRIGVANTAASGGEGVAGGS